MAAKVYTVNGSTAGSSSSLPDWLTRKREGAKSGSKKRARREHVEGTIELIQGFEFPEASNRVRTTRDGTHIVATGTYKPQMRVWDLHQLSLKFERHSDSENVDFVMLSDDWTKSVHIMTDRTIELHAQGGLHYKTRIPRFGRSIAYHFPSCDVYCSASGNEVYRLNLEQGRFMTPITLSPDQGEDEIMGVNCIDVNPAHQLLAFGIDGGGGTAQFWDPRSRSRVGVLRAPKSRLLSADLDLGAGVSVTAISSRSDGLSYAIGTSTGHTLLYDIRAAQPFAMKDQGYGLPLHSLSWVEGGSRMAGDGLVMSADKKVIKIWDRNTPQTNFTSITPANDLNHVHHLPNSGLLMTANEGIQMGTYYIPQLGPAPRWASFLENITEEMEDQTTRSVYEDFKFVSKNELQTLGLDHLIGTPALKPYMHGYFLSLQLYDTARVIANPFIYAEHREKKIQEKMQKLSETRIRTKSSAAAGVKVNKALAEKILRDEERAKRKEARKQKKTAAAAVDADEADEAMDVDEELEEEEQTNGGPSGLLHDPRFSMVFNDPEYQVDEQSREFALLNPSTVVQRKNQGKTAVEEEDEESDKASSDVLGSDSEEAQSESEFDSDDEGELSKFDPRRRPGQKNLRAEEAFQRNKETNRARNRVANVPLAPVQARGSGAGGNKNATFGQRRFGKPSTSMPSNPGPSTTDGGAEISWVPSKDAASDAPEGGKNKKESRRKGVETFGAGLERGGGGLDQQKELSENERHGRTQRRKGIRSGSKNVFRSLDKK